MSNDMLKEPTTYIVIKFSEEAHIESLQKGEVYISKLKNFIQNNDLEKGIFDEDEGNSRSTRCLTDENSILKLSYEEIFHCNKEYPIWCLYEPYYHKEDNIIKIQYEKNIFPEEYDYALIIDSQKLKNRIEKWCDSNNAIYTFHNVLYVEQEKTIIAPYQKLKRFEEQREVRYVFLENNSIGKNKDEVEIYPPYKINGESTIINIGDISDISEVVEVKKLDGYTFEIK